MVAAVVNLRGARIGWFQKQNNADVNTYLYHIAQAKPYGQNRSSFFVGTLISGTEIIRKWRYRKGSFGDLALSECASKASWLQSVQWNLYWPGSTLVCSWFCSAIIRHASEIMFNALHKLPSWSSFTALLFNSMANWFILKEHSFRFLPLEAISFSRTLTIIVCFTCLSFLQGWVQLIWMPRWGLFECRGENLVFDCLLAVLWSTK